jgi:hypothetical protein
MIVSIMQPAYLPWLGYFDRIAQSDVHIVLNTVPLDRSSKTRFTNRNKILTQHGPVWLTVPVKTAGLGHPPINSLEVGAGDRWAEKHWRTVLHAYSSAPHFSEHRAPFEAYFDTPWARLDGLLREGRNYLLRELGIRTTIVESSELQPAGQKSELILNLCRQVGARRYLSGPFGRDYLDAPAFERAGVAIEYHDYVHPEYSQVQPGFEPYMSVIDLLFNHGPQSLAILRHQS